MSYVPGKSDAKKALRYRQRGAENLTPEQAEWLSGYEEALIARGVPRRTSKYTKEYQESNTPTEENENEAGENPTKEDDKTGNASGNGNSQPEPGHSNPDDGNAPDVEPPTQPRPPKPPRVNTDSPRTDGKRQSGNWREKYSGGSSVDGREQTCLTIATQAIGILTLMSEQIRLSGAEPVIEPKLLFNAMVLTVDDVLPDDLTVKPQHIAVGGSIAIISHRFLRRKEIADAIKKQSTAGKDEFGRKYSPPAQAPSAPPPVPPAPPPPPPAPPPPPPQATKVEPPKPTEPVYNDRDAQVPHVTDVEVF